MDPDPAILVINLKDANKIFFVLPKLLCFLRFEGSFTSLQVIISHKDKTVGIKVILTIFA